VRRPISAVPFSQRGGCVGSTRVVADRRRQSGPRCGPFRRCALRAGPRGSRLRRSGPRRAGFSRSERRVKMASGRASTIADAVIPGALLPASLEADGPGPADPGRLPRSSRRPSSTPRPPGRGTPDGYISTAPAASRPTPTWLVPVAVWRADDLGAPAPRSRVAVLSVMRRPPLGSGPPRCRGRDAATP
jgi:hypothetical protein